MLALIKKKKKKGDFQISKEISITYHVAMYLHISNEESSCINCHEQNSWVKPHKQ